LVEIGERWVVTESVPTVAHQAILGMGAWVGVAPGWSKIDITLPLLVPTGVGHCEPFPVVMATCTPELEV